MKGLPVIGPGDRERAGRDARVGDAARALRHAPARRSCWSRPSTTPSAGFPITSILSQGIAEYAPGNPDPEWHRVFCAGGRAPAPGEMFVQPDLARTLARPGHRGPRSLLSRPRGAGDRRAHGGQDGFLTAGRSRPRTRGEWGEPICHDVSRLHRVRDAAADAGRDRAAGAQHARGRVDLAKLPAALGRAPAPAAGGHQARLRRPGLLDRRSGRARPCRSTGMLDKAYAAAAAAPVRSPTRRRPPTCRASPRATPPASSSPTATATCVSVIQSLFNAFGSGVVPPGTGFCLQNRGRHFTMDPRIPARWRRASGRSTR